MDNGVCVCGSLRVPEILPEKSAFPSMHPQPVLRALAKKVQTQAQHTQPIMKCASLCVCAPSGIRAQPRLIRPIRAGTGVLIAAQSQFMAPTAFSSLTNDPTARFLFCLKGLAMQTGVQSEAGRGMCPLDNTHVRTQPCVFSVLR